ncbi:MAG TPA: hypothetical protein VKB38_12975 [Terracidiphilus sp.]|nr:hypothetical protein [Terracidiphilus sp.]
MPDPNLQMLEEAAQKLGPLIEDVVFVGGATLGLLIDDPAAAPIRPTRDVDVIAEILTYVDYIAFSERLRSEHFSEDAGHDPIACRWHKGDLILDVLPLDERVLGYTNRWYRGALANAVLVRLAMGKSIRVIAAPFFLGTKMEAFRGRGHGDYLASRDLEDFVAVVDGRESILEEIERAPNEIRAYLAQACGDLLGTSSFLDVLPGYVLDEGRVPVILKRLAAIAGMR